MASIERQDGRMQRRRRRRTRAYSFVELLIVLLILGIAAAIAAPRTADALMRLRATAAAKRVMADLSLARRTAATSGKPQAIVFDSAGNRYSLPGVAHLDRPGSDYEVELADTGYAATLISADFAGSETFAFDYYGRPSSGGEIVIQSGSVQKTIYVDADTGRATLP